MKILRVKQQDGTLVDIPFGVSNSSSDITTHNKDTSAHADIREQLGQLAAKETVLYSKQELTDEQKTQVRDNIGAINSWNELKDKPFYEEPPVTTTTVLLPESTYEGFEDGGFESNSDIFIFFKPDIEYIITWDGVEYTATTKKINLNGVNCITCGNPILFGAEEDSEDNGQPFFIAYAEEYMVILLISNDIEATSHTIGITQTVTTQKIHKLDDKYINAEWLPQKTMTSTVGVVETAMTVTSMGEVLPNESYDMNALLSAEYCEVLWNDTIYKCIAQQIETVTCIGNTSMILPTMPDSGEPFIFLCGDLVGGVVVVTPAEIEVTFSITCCTTIFSTIPEEYLPKQLQFGNEHEIEVPKETITWDGDTTGRATLEALNPDWNFLYHVSNTIPTLEDLSNGGFANIEPSQSFEFTLQNITDLSEGNRFILSIGSIFIISDIIEQMIGCPAGIYFGKIDTEYISSFTINNYTFVEKETKIKTIDPKYLPKDFGGGSNLPEVNVDNEGAFLRVVNGEWTAVMLPRVEEGEF